MNDVETLADGVAAGDRRVLARAITLVESLREDHRQTATALIERLMPRTGGAVRIGVTGAPGAGKSTFIEAFGLHLTEAGLKVAVFAIDPSSRRSGGSILGDKTRMEALGRSPQAFIRPSPSGLNAGGVARRTREAMLLAEAARFDVVIVETVGVGQSELAAADMVDTFCLLIAPGGGDSLQGIKRGIVEQADVMVVTKADGALQETARQTASDYRRALGLMPPPMPGWRAPVVETSALEGRGVGAVWDAVQRHRAQARTSGVLEERRAGQALAWMWREIEAGLQARFFARDGVKQEFARLEREVAAGRVAPTAAALGLLARL